MPDVLLYTDARADPARRRTIVNRLGVHAAIQVYGCSRLIGNSGKARLAAAARPAIVATLPMAVP